MIKQQENFRIENYGKQSVFSSFLPGIAGIRGIPIWCYYVNRGQCVVSFGVDNKDHAIMEFYPAHQAYQNVKTTGFRTFIKKDGRVWETFSDETIEHRMQIAMNGLEIEEENEQSGLRTNVFYYTLPEEKLGALVRMVTVENISQEQINLELLDGMPAVIPYGVSLENIKNMSQTAKAWMQVEDVEKCMPFFKVRAGMEDTASVKEIEGGNFSAACLKDGELITPIVDASVIFSYDTSLQTAAAFKEHSLRELYETEQMTQNQFPCSFYGVEKSLAPGEQFTLYEIIGQVENKQILENYFMDKKDAAYFALKRKEARELAEKLTDGIETKTASKTFDSYCRYTYMDNILRGGYPMRLGNNKIFYVYSRKHGDLERDYNYFSMLPEFYSQGNGNFRDVNQNRRCDVFFAPFVGRENIRRFYSFIQLDGYNPLGIEKLTYHVSVEKAKSIAAHLPKKQGEQIFEFVTKPFTPGELYRRLDEVFESHWNEALFIQIIDFAEEEVNGNFLEGYWCDHWTYNLDLIFDYLEIFPEEEQKMLYENVYTTFRSQIPINRRALRYEETKNGLRQYHALDETAKREPNEEKLVRTRYGKGEILKVTLMEKLLLLCTVKFAALDAYGMGIEMEGGKPGWYDALNGMPGVLGSSMAETYELVRMISYTIEALKRYPRQVEVIEELGCLIEELDLINRLEQDSLYWDEEVLSFWNRINDAKEKYWEKTYAGISGNKMVFQTENLVDILENWQKTLWIGIKKACRISGDICPTYFTYEVMEYEKRKDGGICPLKFQVKSVPFFLEGPVRYLKLKRSIEEKKRLYQSIKESDLYDRKLSMYKVNESLKDASFELGRARAFTPGWLENESIWLHMEYKYLLELLRSGLYKEFFEDFHKAAVPFLDPQVYGRSIYENSSFLVSSKNQNVSLHGKGFVARLSGSTIEFISMWKRMMFGAQTFSVKNGELAFTPQPVIPSYLITEDGKVSAALLSKIKVNYHFSEKMDYIPGNYQIKNMRFTYANGRAACVEREFVTGKLAEDIRSCKVKEIFIEVKAISNKTTEC